MLYRWLTIGGLITLSLGVGFIALNYDNATQPQRIGYAAPPVDSAQRSEPHSASETEYQHVVSQQTFETQSERIEAQMLSELETLNQDIANEKVRLDRETAEALSTEESPELVIARANAILAELESEGIVLNYNPMLLAPDAVSPDIQVIEEQVVKVETDLIDVEKRFNNLGNNKESL